MKGMNSLLDRVLYDFIDKITALAAKYETTFFCVEKQIQETEEELSAMLEELDGNEFDLRGLAEFGKLLGGGKNE